MSGYFLIDGKQVKYELNYKNNKNLYIRMDKDFTLLINAPKKMKFKDIEVFAISSYPKLFKKRINKEKKQVRNVFVDDNKVKIMGQLYKFENKSQIDTLLKNQLKVYLDIRFKQICEMMEIVKLPSLRFVRVKTYLGQYNKRKNQVSLNILIGHLDEKLIDYVLIHELSHIKYLHHQKAFWDHVKIYCPSYKEERKLTKKEFMYYENN